MGNSQNTTLALGLAGAVVGTVVGVGPALGFALGSAAGSLLAGASEPADSRQVHEQESLSTLKVMSSAYGQPIPKLFGTAPIAGNIISAADKVEHIQETEELTGGGGGKGGGAPTTTTVTRAKTYTVTFAMGICEGPIVGIETIKFYENVYFDISQPDPFTVIATTDLDEPIVITHPDQSQIIRIYRGTENQLPDPDIELIEGIGQTPAYRGLAYAVFVNLDLGTTGDLPNIQIKVSSSSLPTGQPIDAHYFTYDDGRQTLFVTYSSSSFATRGLSTTVELTADTLEPIRKFPAGSSVVATDVRSLTSLEYIALANAGTHSLSSVLLLDQTILYDTDLRTPAEITAGTAADVRDVVFTNNGTYAVSLAALDRIEFVQAIDGIRTTPAATNGTPNRLFHDVNTGFVWVANDSGTVQVIDEPTVLNTFGTIGEGPQAFVATASDVWVTLSTPGVVRRFAEDGSAQTAQIPVGAGPTAIAVAGDGFVWVANSGDSTVSRIDPVGNAVQSLTVPATPTLVCPESGGRMFVISDITNTAYLVDTTGSVVAQTFLSDGAFLSIPGPTGVSYVLTNNSSLVWRLEESSPGTLSALTPGVSNGLGCVVRDLCSAAGVPSESINVAGLDNAPVNLLLTNVTAARGPLERLFDAYAFTMVESEGQLKFYYLGGTAHADIAEATVSAGGSGATTSGLNITRLQALELPTRVTITYPSLARNFEPGTQSRSLSTHKTPANHLKLNFPVALTDQQAQNIAEVHLFSPHLNVQHYGATLPPRWIALEPVDIIQLQARGLPYLARLVDINIGSNWVLEMRAVNHRSYIYENFQGLPGDQPSGDVVLETPVTSLGLLADSPPLSTTDFGVRFHAGLGQQAAGAWPGAQLYRSLDNQATFSQIAAATVPAVLGIVPVATPVGITHTWDEVTTIDVTVPEGTLVSRTDLDILNGLNRFMLINPATNQGELLQYVFAVLIGQNVYRLSRLLRGRQGTEDLVDQHVVNETFLLLDTRAQETTYSETLLDTLLPYRVASTIEPLATAPTQQVTLIGRSMTPWRPIVHAAVRDSGTGDWSLFWLERARLTPIPLTTTTGIARDPDATGYEVQIYRDQALTNLARTILVPLQANPEATVSVVYTAAEQVIDSAVIQLGFPYVVRQLTALRRGVPAPAQAGDVASSLLEALVAYWTLDEAQGAPRIDSTGNGHTLVDGDVGQVLQIIGQVATAARVTATNDRYLTTPNTALLSMGAETSFTIAAWVQLEVLLATRTIVSKPGEYRLEYEVASSRFAFELNNGTTTTTLISASAPAVDGNWHLVIASYDADLDTMALYVDDASVDTIAHAGGAAPSTNNLDLGFLLAPLGYWAGGIDEAAIWRRDLTALERTALFNGGVGTTHPFVITPPLLVSGAYYVQATLTPSLNGQYAIVGEPAQLTVVISGTYDVVFIPALIVEDWEADTQTIITVSGSYNVV